MNEELRVIILAAGKGTRMNSDLPKVLQQMILRSFILPFRPQKTKKAYETKSIFVL
mgnify:CR=1 FL=1